MLNNIWLHFQRTKQALQFTTIPFTHLGIT
ncbi:hypothetical protein CDEF62S_03476 [Castellaniella defragrans]